MRPGELWLLAARPSIGKSLLALQTAADTARRGILTAFFSLEMPGQQLLRRLVSRQAQIGHYKLRSGSMGEWERTMAQEGLTALQDLPLRIFADVGNYKHWASIASTVRKRKWGLVVLDYLGLVDIPGRHENQNQRISWLSRNLKLLALECDVPILALAQLNRGNEHESRKPTLSDLRDSGSLEQDADGVLFLHAPHIGKGKADGAKEETEAIVGKQRDGERNGGARLWLQGDYCRFLQWDERPGS